MTLVDKIKAIQRAVGAEPDGVFGPMSAELVLSHLSAQAGIERSSDDDQADFATQLDARTVANIATLDPKARDRFEHFALMAKATAATFGCDYVMISGNRTWAEQDALYARGRTAPGLKVTNARGGQSNHNFGIAGDFGVFQGRIYLDGGNAVQQDLAARVHAACAVQARKLGLEWGGDWKSLKDFPHFEIGTGLGLAQKRELYQRKGSVL